MIAQGKAISHGARAIEYSMEKEKAQLVKVHDLPENIEPLAMWSRMMQHQHQCMKDRYNPKPIKLNALRFEISPAKEESAGWTMTDWQNLADEFIAVLDGIDRRCGKPDSHLKPTNIKNSQYVVSLHTDSKSGIPHLHIVANRIDNMGKTNDAHIILVNVPFMLPTSSMRDVAGCNPCNVVMRIFSKSVKTASQY